MSRDRCVTAVTCPLRRALVPNLCSDGCIVGHPRPNDGAATSAPQWVDYCAEAAPVTCSSIRARESRRMTSDHCKSPCHSLLASHGAAHRLLHMASGLVSMDLHGLWRGSANIIGDGSNRGRKNRSEESCGAWSARWPCAVKCARYQRKRVSCCTASSYGLHCAHSLHTELFYLFSRDMQHGAATERARDVTICVLCTRVPHRNRE